MRAAAVNLEGRNVSAEGESLSAKAKFNPERRLEHIPRVIVSEVEEDGGADIGVNVGVGCSDWII